MNRISFGVAALVAAMLMAATTTAQVDLGMPDDDVWVYEHSQAPAAIQSYERGDRTGTTSIRPAIPGFLYPARTSSTAMSNGISAMFRWARNGTAQL